MASVAICVADGELGSLSTVVLSADTDESMLEVSVGKSFLAAVTAAFAVLWTLETADVTEETPFDRSISFRSCTASSRSSALEQYEGLLLPQPAVSSAARTSARATATAGRRDGTAGNPTLSQTRRECTFFGRRRLDPPAPSGLDAFRHETTGRLPRRWPSGLPRFTSTPAPSPGVSGPGGAGVTGSARSAAGGAFAPWTSQ